MKFVALHYQHHDANLTYFDGEKAHYCKTERPLQIKKHHYKRSDLMISDTFSDVHRIQHDTRFMNIPWHDLDAVMFTMSEVVHKPDDDALNWTFPEGEWVREVSEDTFFQLFPLFDCTAKKYIRIEHHYAHKLSADWLFGESDKALVIDGAGDYQNWLSVFDKENRVVDYRTWDGVSIGHLYAHAAMMICEGVLPDAVHQHENSGSDDAGKVMGLMSYGEYNEEYAESLKKMTLPEACTHAMNDWFCAMTYKGGQHVYPEKFETLKQTNMTRKYQLDWIHTWQEVILDKVVDLISEYVAPDEKFSFSGGVAHNVVLNERLARKFPNMVIPPCVGDEGQSLGAMYWMLRENGISCDWPSGQASDEVIEFPNEDNIESIAQCVAHGEVVAVCVGEGEIGPRALGNRSILYRPDLNNAPAYFNTRGIKKREWWRPYGISILAEDMTDYIDTDHLSPHMLHTANVVNHEKLKGVEHVDGSVRYQTITEENGWYYKVLKRIKELTGLSAIVNTSLNVPGKPLVHSRADALGFMMQSKPDMIVIGNEKYRND